METDYKPNDVRLHHFKPDKYEFTPAMLIISIGAGLIVGYLVLSVLPSHGKNMLRFAQ